MRMVHCGRRCISYAVAPVYQSAGKYHVLVEYHVLRELAEAFEHFPVIHGTGVRAEERLDPEPVEIIL